MHRFPAQQKVGGDSKIPSIIYYDREGNVRAVGAEATQEAFLEQAEEEELIRVEWYVHPSYAPSWLESNISIFSPAGSNCIFDPSL